MVTNLEMSYQQQKEIKYEYVLKSYLKFFKKS